MRLTSTGHDAGLTMVPTDREQCQNAIRREYAHLAPEYDRRWSFYIEATTSATLARLSSSPTARILDVGCGTGVLLQRLAQNQPRATLTGIDPVPEMLTVARRRVPLSIELHEGWVEELPFADSAFDLVISCSMFHYVRQPVVALREIGRVLRPGGELVITDWCNDYRTCRVCSLWLRLTGSSHVRAYGERECRRLLGETGYSQAQIERYKINYLWGLMTAKAAKPARI
ncbi:MAG: class I SAM-dependent methyltransferase [Bryobacteraceae bacterium]